MSDASVEMKDLHEAVGGDAVPSAAPGLAGLNIDDTLWALIEALAAARRLSVSAVAVAGLATVLDRISDGPVSIWGVADRPASAIEPVPFGPVKVTIAQRNLVAAAQDAMDQLLHARPAKAADGDPPLWWFEFDGAEDALRGADRSGGQDGCLATASDPIAASASGLIRIVLRPPNAGNAGTLHVAADHAILPAERARSLAQAWQHLMQAALRRPEALLDDLPVASVHDRAKNWPAVPAAVDCALADDPCDMAALFAAIVDRWPDATAIVWPQGSLTFAELDRAADAIAWVLRNRRIGPSDTIALRVSADAPPGSSVLYLCATIIAFRVGCAIMPLRHALRKRSASADLPATIELPAADHLPAWQTRAFSASEGYPCGACMSARHGARATETESTDLFVGTRPRPGAQPLTA